MLHTINILPEAEKDLFLATDWYDSCQMGLGERFEEDVEYILQVIAEFPKLFPRIHPPFRRAVLASFPYVVVYRDREHTVDIVAIFPGKMHPGRLEMRLKS